VNIEPIKFLKAAKNTPLRVLLAVIALGIVWAIIKHRDVTVLLCLIGILALIVLPLVVGAFRRL
jgi:hypothetical protein